MAGDNQDKTGALPGGDNGKRKPPTIDLAATDVTESPRVFDAPETPGATASASAHSETSAESTADPKSESSASSSPATSRASSIVLSAIMGAVAAVLVLAGAKFAGLLDPPPPATALAAKSDVDALGTRVAKIETDVAKPVPAPRPVTDPAIVTRLDAVEKSLTSLRGDVAAVRGQSEKTSAAISELKSAPPQSVMTGESQAAPAVDTSAIEERIAKIERATAALSAAATAPAPQPVETPNIRRLDAVINLEKAMRHGAPYAPALVAARSVAGDSDALRALDPFAASGIPSADALCKELLALLPQLAPKPEAPPAPSGIIERLQQSFVKLVRIQRTDTPASGAAGIIARATAAAQRNDLSEAKREILLLPPTDRVPARPWIAKVEGRDKALAASEQFTMDTLTAISKSAQ